MVCHAIVVANGELPPGYEHRLHSVGASADVVIAADGGLRHCAALDLWPSVLVGDLDSAPAELVHQAHERGVRVAAFAADKDATDLELALHEALAAGATRITVIAAFGGRLDHEVATLGLLAADTWRGADVTACDGRRNVWIVRSTIEMSLAIGQTVSLVPWAGDTTGITTAGLRWPLRAETLVVGSTRGVSNVAEDPIQLVSIDTGILLVIADAVEEIYALTS